MFDYQGGAKVRAGLGGAHRPALRGLPGAYWETVHDRLFALAFVARYGHQSLSELLGRPPTDLELHVFVACLVELREAEVPAWAGGGDAESE